ncbi:hypothetical protein C8F04DRAFT_955023 [Mycena alexandri]|uniref:J domain-containing protein n=1 Tax=Mycena alexandri TaxID=1745969 RepID=A0AAD6SZD4_9AGAR|nr:hypothetical protein C8F04DRAFT_955023 [Mycena alexandri]
MDPDQSFYDVLQIPRDATTEQIRKAYKKAALSTHPDRLPAGYTAADKVHAEERFRQVSNAYEVLKDPESRQLYDTHGVWPPPAPPPEQPYSPRHSSHRGGPRPNRYEPFPDPFENFFSEPFELFDRIFSSYRRPSYHPVHRSYSNFNRDPFEAMYRMQDLMADLERDMFSSFPSRSLSLGFEASPFGGGSQVRWAHQSSAMVTHNGVTHRIEKRRDFDGNEHVTRTYPDGRETYTVNGVEQQQHYLPPPGPPPPSRDHRSMHLPPPQMNNPRGYIPPPPSYRSHSPHSSMHSGHNNHNRGRRPDFPAWDAGSSAIVPPNEYHRHRHSSGASSPPAVHPD